MKKILKYNPTIGQNILISTLSIVSVILIFTSVIYYATFSESSETMIESQSKELNKQIVLNYENYINSVIETANFLQFSSLNMDLDEEYDKLKDIFAYNNSIKKDIVSIYLFNVRGEKILGDEHINITNKSITREKWFIESLSERSITHFSAPFSNGLSLKIDEEVLFLSRYVEYLKGGIKRNGVLLVELNFKELIELAEKTNLGSGGHILIIDDEDTLVYQSNNSNRKLTDQSKKLAIENFIGGLNATINQVEYYININTLIHTRWRIVTVNNVDDIASARRRIFSILFIILFISLLLTTLISFFISKRITQPLSSLQNSMLKLETGDFNTKVAEKGQKEVVSLSRSFNSMIDKIRTLMDEVVEEQRETRRNELKALQNQINPHFLYNTLDSIVWLAENQRTDDVITTVVALARFFRISISKGATRITVNEEISHIENYLTIQKIRYVDKFTYTMDISDEVKDLKVMKLILQPIVENAIYHGIGDDMEYIQIRSFRDDKFLYFEVENSGYGITEEKIEEIQRSLRETNIKSSVGLKNVYQRIKLFYGERADIELKSTLDESTTIKIIIPLYLRSERR